MIPKDSRYVTGRLRVNGDDVLVQRRFPTPAARFRYIIWAQGMRLDLLSARLFGDPKQWWRILDMNPLVQSPTDLRPGMHVKVPDV